MRVNRPPSGAREDREAMTGRAGLKSLAAARSGCRFAVGSAK